MKAKKHAVCDESTNIMMDELALFGFLTFTSVIAFYAEAPSGYKLSSNESPFSAVDIFRKENSYLNSFTLTSLLVNFCPIFFANAYPKRGGHEWRE